MTNLTPTHRLAIAGKRVALLLVACFLPVACHSSSKKEAATSEMQALAEARWPGKFALHRTRLRGDLQGYEVIFVARDDANFRLHLDHREQKRCQPEACDRRLERAYAIGASRAAQLNAGIAAFARCDVPLQGILSDRLHWVVALDLHARADAELARLTPCIEAYWKEIDARSAALHGAEKRLDLRVQQIARPPVPAPARIDWDSREGGDSKQAVYNLPLLPDTPLPVRVANLRIAIDGTYYDQLESRILADVKRHLDSALPGAGLNAITPRAWKIEHDPHDIQLLHAQVLVCSPAAFAANPRNCDEDMAVQLRHDRRSQKTEIVQTLRDIRDRLGIVTLSPRPPREGATE